jgi:hypothetical protein
MPSNLIVPGLIYHNNFHARIYARSYLISESAAAHITFSLHFI